jgi:hypothetical protein
MLNKHSFRFAAMGTVVWALVLAGLVVSTTPACADSYVRWLPMVWIGNSTVTGPGTWFGDNTSGLFYKIDSPATDNEVWSVPEVFYDDPTYEKSEYHQFGLDGGVSADFDLGIHNPTANDMSVALAVYDGWTGVVVDDSRVNTKSGWSSVWKCFIWTVDAGSTKKLDQDEVITPPASGTAHYTMKLWSAGENADYFTVSYRHIHRCSYRTGSGQTSSSFSHQQFPYYFSYGYTGFGEELLDGITSPRLRLPYWQDTTDDGEDYYSHPRGWSTAVWIANIENEDCDMTVDVYELDGTLIKSYEFDGDEAVPKNALLLFLPSQFLDEGDPEEGYLEVTSVLSSDGETPADILGFANVTLFTKTPDLFYDNGYHRGRYQSNHVAHFDIEDDG